MLPMMREDVAHYIHRPAFHDVNAVRHHRVGSPQVSNYPCA